MVPRKWTHEQLFAAVAAAACWYDVLRSLGLKLGGGTVARLKVYCETRGVSTAHFLGRAKPHRRGRGRYMELDKILVKDSLYKNSAELKKRLVAAGMLVERCDICGLVEWREKPITLILDHKNGNHQDNRFENLHLVCPNCDSQQPTWLGRNRGWRDRQVP